MKFLSWTGKITQLHHSAFAYWERMPADTWQVESQVVQTPFYLFHSGTHVGLLETHAKVEKAKAKVN